MLLYLFSFFLVSFSYANQEASKSVSSENKKPLVLQWEVSYPRNTDQISLIFKKETVEMVTNTSFQTRKIAQLGSFSIPINSYFKILEKRIYQYYIRLKNTLPIASLIKGRKTQPPVHPHAPILHINDQKINHEHIYFKTLKDILFQEIKNKDWRCQECATYILLNTKQTKIQRTVQKNGKTTTKTFTEKELNCRSEDKNTWECLDLEFGTFALKKIKNRKESNKQKGF